MACPGWPSVETQLLAWVSKCAPPWLDLVTQEQGGCAPLSLAGMVRRERDLCADPPLASFMTFQGREPDAGGVA